MFADDLAWGAVHCGVVSTTYASNDRPRKAVHQRLRSHAVLESLNVPLQAWIWFRVIDVPATVANLSGFGAFAVLLVVGTAYWVFKLRRGEARLSTGRLFAAAGVLLRVVLGLVLIACTVAVIRTPGWQSWPGLVLAVFAVLEYVNYFHVQLMHDTRADFRRLVMVGFRRSHLSRDLQGLKAASR